jgi:hypothetical protein
VRQGSNRFIGKAHPDFLCLRGFYFVCLISKNEYEIAGPVPVS